MNTNDRSDGLSRRSVVKAAAWATPAVAVAVAAPMAAASKDPLDDVVLRSKYGIGYYPMKVNKPKDGYLQFDSHHDKFLYVDGLKSGDIITDVWQELLISTSWKQVEWYRMSGSNLDWSSLVYRTRRSLNGEAFRVYESRLQGSFTASGSQLQLPLNFYHYARTSYQGQRIAQCIRYLTVARGNQVKTLTTTLGLTNINNTNVAVGSANHPRP